MLTVMDHASPWLIPRNTLAIMTQFQSGDSSNMIGTGIPNNHPKINIFFLLHLSDIYLQKDLESL